MLSSCSTSSAWSNWVVRGLVSAAPLRSISDLYSKILVAPGMDKSGDACPSSSSAHRQSSSSLARAMSAKTVDELWKEIGQRRGSDGGDQKLGEMTLEDFLVRAGLSGETSRSPSMELELSAEEGSPLDFTPQIGLSSAPSIGSLSDVTTTITRRKRGDPEAYEKAIERRLRRKIKNRESAARSRARKQAYQNELVSKVSHLEEENIRLKKEKEFDVRFPCESSASSKYQLRRTSSASL
ncbi:ABSCISIC ACID-INSENSITIVE 5-like protein 3 isoform X2 [Punica granatum]|uniref:ABSCISIC ACID-INSENSITIVE 5-like protein 3 isoform X2 n=1 Tax=Punica granatum TaxID=22663 RepID=A0A6P8E6V8_PUNGR|nr:ABSCISIC ACID-INSENSITIVE 5-like protein 3 isoform X2 [Punica granatum]